MSTVGDTLVPECPFLVEHTTALIEILRHRLILQLDGHRHGWWSCGRILLDSSLYFYDCCGSSFHVVREVIIIIIRIVVVEVETLQLITF